MIQAKNTVQKRFLCSKFQNEKKKQLNRSNSGLYVRRQNFYGFRKIFLPKYFSGENLVLQRKIVNVQNIKSFLLGEPPPDVVPKIPLRYH